MEIELCKTCNGLGEYKTDTIEGYEYVSCDNCQGNGRVFKLKFNIEFPFTENYSKKAKIINFQEKIAKLIRDESN